MSIAQETSFNIGIVGAGRIARVHGDTIRAHKRTHLIGVTDVDLRQAEKFAQRYETRVFPSFAALLSNRQLDGVIICTPTAFHEEQAVQAAQAGKHILCEKPLALSLGAADRILASAHQAGIILMVGHIVHFMADYVEAHRLLTGGAIGEVHTIRSTRSSGLAGESWRHWLQGDTLGLGAFEAQIHDLDFLLWSLGRPQRITSRGWRADQGGWAHVTSWLDYDDGRWGTAEGSLAVPDGYPFTASLRAIGTTGLLEYNFRAATYAESTAGALKVYPSQGDPQVHTPQPSNPFLKELDHFVECAQSGRQPSAGSGKQARAILAIVLAARRSLLEGGRTVSVEN